MLNIGVIGVGDMGSQHAKILTDYIPQAKVVAAARRSIVEKLQEQCQLAYNSYKRELEGILHPDMIPNKKVSDLDIEVWFKDQLEDETQPFQTDQISTRLRHCAHAFYDGLHYARSLRGRPSQYDHCGGIG